MGVSIGFPSSRRPQRELTSVGYPDANDAWLCRRGESFASSAAVPRGHALKIDGGWRLAFRAVT